MAIVCVGIDLAKNVFAVHGINEAGRPELVRPAVPRDKLLALISALPPCVIGMEACSGAHHWARQFMALCHTVRQRAREHLEDLPGWANTVIGDLLSEVARLDERIAQYDAHIRLIAQADDRAKQLMRLSGAGETTATCLLAMIGNGHDFDCGRQFAAWLGLAPGQYSSGGKARLGRITKAGDAYLRMLFILGARAVLAAAPKKSDPISRWVVALAERRGYWKAVVAMAAKNARMAWAHAAQERGLCAAGLTPSI